MFRQFLCIFIFLIFIRTSKQKSTLDSSIYVGAVVQYHPVTDGNNSQVITKKNFYNFKLIIDTASKYNVDIIVFPEFGLTGQPEFGLKEQPFKVHYLNRSDGSSNSETYETAGKFHRGSTMVKQYRAHYAAAASYVPSPNEDVICTSKDSRYADILKQISCTARDYGIYVAVNLYEREDCPSAANCSTNDGFLLFNTNVVFDRKGRLVARYRKHNLFCEPWTDHPDTPEVSSFTTDFGVTFGQIIDVDLLDASLSDRLFATNPNVTDVIYATRKFEELPFFITIQDWSAWANRFGVNLLAAGFSVNGGSGIHANHVSDLRNYFWPNLEDSIMYAKIPKIGHRHIPKEAINQFSTGVVDLKKEKVFKTENSSHSLIHSWVIEDYFSRGQVKSSVLDPTLNWTAKQLCVNGLCCNFNVEMTFNNLLANKPGTVHYKYHMVAIRGVYEYSDGTTGGIEICAVISCIDYDVRKCGRRFHGNASVVQPMSLDSIIITRSADLHSRGFFAPLTLYDDRLMLSGKDYNFIVNESLNASSQLLLIMKDPKSDLRFFGINGRRLDMVYHPAVMVEYSNSYDVLEKVIGLFILTCFLVFVSVKIWQKFRNERRRPGQVGRPPMFFNRMNTIEMDDYPPTGRPIDRQILCNDGNQRGFYT